MHLSKIDEICAVGNIVPKKELHDHEKQKGSTNNFSYFLNEAGYRLLF
jgi:hypothetical protein